MVKIWLLFFLVVVFNDDVQQSVKHKLDFYERKFIFPKKDLLSVQCC